MDARNYTGIQLIDRNDELCILYEKSNIHDATLRQGEVAMREVEQEVRMLKIQVTELEREIAVRPTSNTEHTRTWAFGYFGASHGVALLGWFA